MLICLYPNRKGVNLWNISGLMLRGADENEYQNVAICKWLCATPLDRLLTLGEVRLAAFRLVEAGLETKPGTESKLNC